MSIPDEYRYKLNTNTGGWVFFGGLQSCTSFPRLAGVTVKVGGFTKQKVHENIAFLLMI